MEIGYALSAEEHKPNDLVKHARLAEEHGFTYALISDHFHPWVDAQGQAPFVWSVIGGIAGATERIRLGTGVTCPTVRIHPAIIAQAAATAAAMMPGRFFLGVGTGENLNEHILCDRWPEWEVRAAMLEEAVELIRELWRGEVTSYHGDFYDVENARIYTLPEELPEIIVAASGQRAAELAGHIGDGLCVTMPNRETVQAFDSAGRPGRPHYGQMTVCWAADEGSARKTAHDLWAFSSLPGELHQELPSPAHFEQGVKIVSEEMVAEKIVCGPDAAKHIAKVREYLDAGIENVYVHQVGPDQAGALEFYARDVLPHFR